MKENPTTEQRHHRETSETNEKTKEEKVNQKETKKERKRERTDPDLRGPARILITALAARPFPICLSRNEHFPSRVPLRLNSYK